jgi:hypothetical protein
MWPTTGAADSASTALNTAFACAAVIDSSRRAALSGCRRKYAATSSSRPLTTFS